jgi:hypothetical protein
VEQVDEKTKELIRHLLENLVVWTRKLQKERQGIAPMISALLKPAQNRAARLASAPARQERDPLYFYHGLLVHRFVEKGTYS